MSDTACPTCHSDDPAERGHRHAATVEQRIAYLSAENERLTERCKMSLADRDYFERKYAEATDKVDALEAALATSEKARKEAEAGRCDTCFYATDYAGDEWCEGWSKTDRKVLCPECWRERDEYAAHEAVKEGQE